MEDDKNSLMSDEKCYSKVLKGGRGCLKDTCRHYLLSEKDLNCTIIASQSGPKTLQEIGDYYGISRMRVCQIEKAILKKLRREKNSMSDFKSLTSEKTDSD